VTGPSTTDWISAGSTAALGFLGLSITVWQWRMTRFRPRLTSRIDARREAIELLIVNRGRASGIVDQVDVLRPSEVIEADAQFEGFTGGAFRPLALPAMASARIIIQAPQDRTFDAGVMVLVGIGKAEPKRAIPAEVPAGLGLFGLRSVLPPGTPL
jgi:hypothetical protein